MKKLLIALVMLVTLITSLSAQDVTVSLTRNYVNGETTWDTFFYYDIFHSRLIYPYSGKTHTLGINVAKSDFFMDFEMGLSNYGNLHFTKYDVNEGRDSDWSGDYLQRVFSSDIIFGNNEYKLNLGVVFNEVSVFGSYYKYIANFQMINGVSRVVPGFFGGLAIHNKPLRTLNSTYDVNYHAFGIGLNKTHHLCSGLQLDGTFIFYPKFTIEGEGYWNLRELRFNHKSQKGKQIIANFSLLVKPIKKLHVKVGYDIVKYWAKGQTTKFGSITSENLSKIERRWLIKNLTRGFNIGLKYNF